MWRVRLSGSPPRLRQLEGALAPAERARAARYRRAVDQVRFVMRRGLLRAILSRYLHTTAGELEFLVTPCGKPFVDPALNPSHLTFNTSHSGDLGLIAVTRGRCVGVDVEQVRADLNIAAFGKDVFSGRERATLAALPRDRSRRVAFEAWALKEAFVKGRGEGLAFSLADVEVSLDPDAKSRLLAVAGKRSAAERWWLDELPVGRGYVGALVLLGGPAAVSCWSWNGEP